MQWRNAVLIPLLVLPFPALARAQTVEGTVRDRTTSKPIRGAFVLLLDSAGNRRMGALTDSLGHFAVSAPVAGSYSLRAEMIGYADSEPARLQLVAAQAQSVHLQLSARAIPLKGIDVRAKPRCRLHSDQAGVELAIWSEARKALSLTDWSARESGLVLVTRRREGYVGRLDHVLGVDTVQGKQPFVTLSPEKIRGGGLIYREGDAHVFYAPGPEYILADDFLATHCFATRLRRDAVGLAFVPVQPARQGDIAGTLWLDRTSLSLDRLEFEYVKLDQATHVRRATGNLAFDRTPRGLWLIRSWSLTFQLTSGGAKETRGDVVESWMPVQASSPPRPPTAQN